MGVREDGEGGKGEGGIDMEGKYNIVMYCT